VPVIRHLISIPAGVGKMNLLQFSLYTVVGACIWNVFLAWLGYHMGTHWELIHQYSRQIDLFMIIPVSVAVYLFVKTHRKRKASRA